MAFAYYEYKVRRSDSLNRIISDMYSWNPERQPRTYAESLRGVLALNPHITDPDHLLAGTILRLPENPTSSALRHVRPEALKQQGFASESLTGAEKEQVNALAWLAYNSNWLTVPGSLATGSATAILSAGNRQLVTDIGDLYAEYKRGKITRTAYKAKRAAKLDQFRRNMGPLFERMLYAKKGVGGAMRQGIQLLPPRISRTEVTRLRQIASRAAAGGIVLTGVGLTAACVEIAHAQDQATKNEVFVETVVSTTAGIVGGALIGLYLVSNPIGWGSALVLTIGSSAASSYLGGQAKKAYNLYLGEVDFANGTGLSKICR